MTTLVYKIVTAEDWRAAEAMGRFEGAAVDRRDGFIHLSSGAQVRETAALHFGGLSDLRLVAVDAARLGSALRWEPSRNGALFPHLFGVLTLDAVRWSRPLLLGPDGRHVIADDVA